MNEVLFSFIKDDDQITFIPIYGFFLEWILNKRKFRFTYHSVFSGQKLTQSYFGLSLLFGNAQRLTHVYFGLILSFTTE